MSQLSDFARDRPRTWRIYSLGEVTQGKAIKVGNGDECRQKARWTSPTQIIRFCQPPDLTNLLKEERLKWETVMNAGEKPDGRHRHKFQRYHNTMAFPVRFSTNRWQLFALMSALRNYSCPCVSDPKARQKEDRFSILRAHKGANSSTSTVLA